MELWKSALFYAAGISVLAHVALCFLLRRSLLERPQVLCEFFAIPNERLIGDLGVRLLRARYYIPWKSMPIDMQSMSRGQLSLLTLARITGVLMPICWLSFLALSFIQATR